jgi:predicted metal-dependent phosphotriesterase family hydrolase
MGPGPYLQKMRCVMNIAMPLLKELNEQHCKIFVDGTPDFPGRDVKLLEKLSRATGISIVNTHIEERRVYKNRNRSFNTNKSYKSLRYQIKNYFIN